MNILITGGLGFIGSNLAIYLIKKNYNITIIDNMYSGKKRNIPSHLNIKIINENVETCNFRHFENIDIVFHFAAISSLPECQSNPLLAYNTNVIRYN